MVVGPDGAGKTSVVDALERLVAAPLARAHSRPGLIAARPGGAGPVTEPHAAAPRGRAASVAKLAVVLADTVLGTWLRWRPAARRQLVVVERGWYDLAVDPHRYRLPGSLTPLVRRLGRVVPRADLAVVLAGPPEVLHRRKPEIGADEVARQLAAWEVLAARAGRRVLRLDTAARDPEACAAALVAALAGPPRRWWRVPLAPPRLGLRATGPGPALAIYRPHRPWAKVAAAVNTPLLRLRLAPPAGPPPVPHLADLVGRGPQPAHQLAALRSSQPDRWVVGVADTRRLHTVVKVGLSTDAGLAREVAALERLTPSADVVVPELRWAEQRDGWLAAATTALPAGAPPPSLDRVATATTALTRGDLGVPVVHGDLAPWNLAVTGDRLAIWDWEEAELGVARPLHDLTHYVVRAGRLLGAFGPAEAARLLTAPGGPGAGHLTALDLPPGTAPELVRGYLARTRAADRAEDRFRAAMAAALPAASGLRRA